MATDTAFVYDAEYLTHDTGFGHPERPQRLRAIQEALETSGLDSTLKHVAPRRATVDDLARVHHGDHIEAIREMSAAGGGRLGYDTPLSAESYDVALLSAGGVLAAVDAVVDGDVQHAFSCGRPPGHHATPTQAMGFCLFNNIAVAARYAQREKGLPRILIVDWDVHHGNGTQDAFYDDGDVFFFSIHQSPLYPGSGTSAERGVGAGEGATLNAPVPAGSVDADYIAIFEETLIPVAREFSPDLVMISAGFDAHEDDPLAGVHITTDGFAQLTRLARDIAEEQCGGRIVSTLEGGYSLRGLSASVVAHLQALTE
ncbi:histone deacetylase [Candidatus Poribacteria bacterium]|mgnify:CR=1 FL=1|jgi:acetoin utilization deacetylase AcuC-like enzyme|nr:histone deacetylase [Candidatus Poribacteria bacterium]MBT5531689.1 histone deacetylase [Candidatus Poribacteria bacterium]MBT5710973.1 histone deacetylase [Candidatus Poribacteria bacterium]MBT7096314.1 histone deacetylase [Candidatus Poribacteria bacterium]MBT7804967.1 histone deacetylase [Candidatus Poribacteria bacterium]